MVTLHIPSLRSQAKTLLAQTRYDPKKLVLLHTAVSLGATLLMTFINYLFSLQIADTGGLGGLGLRSLLETAQSVLELIVMLALPFWQIGLVYTALRWARSENAEPAHLLQGFRRFGAVFRFRLLYAFIFCALGFSLIYICTTVFMLTPWAEPLMAVFAPIAEAGTPEQMEALLTPALIDQVTANMIPLLILCGAVFAVVAIPLFYRLRFAEFAVMDGMRATQSVVNSLRLTHKNSLQILKIDLHFWWFYLLQALTLVVCYGDALLSMIGISLPISADAGFFLFYVLGILLQGILVWRYQDVLSTTYCLAYDTCRESIAPPEPVPEPANTPWSS